MADEIVDYPKGLGIKAMERDLTEFELNVLSLLHPMLLVKTRLVLLQVYPSKCSNKMDPDSWEDRERELEESLSM